MTILRININLAIIFSLLLFGTSCSGEKTAQSTIQNTFASNIQSTNPLAIKDINSPPGQDLATAGAVLEAIDSIENLERIKATWLLGEWASYDSGGISYKAIFNKDGSYITQATVIQDGKSIALSSSGQWLLYQRKNSQGFQLFLTDDNDPLSIENFPIEQEGPDGFRIVHSYELPIARSTLYSRLSTDIAIYPGMFLLGDYNYAVPSDSYTFRNLVYSFRKNGQLTLYDSINTISITEADQHEENEYHGTWQLDAANAKLIINVDGASYSFAIQYANTAGLGLLNLGTGNQLYLEKINEGKLRASVINIAGEYQSLTNESYFSIRASQNGYLVDYYADLLDFMSFYNVPAKALPDGSLAMVFPKGHINEGQEIILSAGYNRLVMAKGFDLPDYNMQKVSNNSLTHNPMAKSVLGTWRSALLADSGSLSTMNYISFFKDGRFKTADSYGKYSFENQKITLNKVCAQTESYSPSFKNHTLELAVPYSAVPGLRDWAEDGSKIGEILFKHALDAYQLLNSPKLKPHPSIKGAYLFANETIFNALITYDDFISYTLLADGTGRYHAGNIEAQGISHSGDWVQLPNFGSSYGIKYFIVQEGDKEYIVYYPSGYLIIYADNKFEYIDKIKEDNKDNVRIVELYHRRTAICEPIADDFTILPLSKE